MTVQYDKFGHADKRHSIIACNYLKTWFVIDLFAVIPFETILTVSGLTDSDANVDAVHNIVKITKTARLVRIAKIFRIIRYIKLLGD
jgi:hypothetical protein